MSRMSTPRGRLPARVYWFRRCLVLVVALVLVFGIARLLSGFGGDDSGAGATTVAQTGGAEPAHLPGVTLSAKPGTKLSAPLSQPTGSCADDEVKVVPDVGVLSGGGAQPLALDVTSTTGGTCTWKVSAQSLVLRIIKGDRRVWSSQDCPRVMTTSTIVVRPPEETATRLEIGWGGHTSQPGCPGGQGYVGIGSYTLEAASLGGEPADANLLIVAPPRPRVTETASAKPSGRADARPSSSASSSPGAKASSSPTAKASGRSAG